MRETVPESPTVNRPTSSPAWRLFSATKSGGESNPDILKLLTRVPLVIGRTNPAQLALVAKPPETGTPSGFHQR